MILDQMYSAPLLPVHESNMSNYPNVLTPPSSNEDSPQPVYFVASPNSSSFHAPEDYDMAQIPFNILTDTQPMIDPNILMGNLPKASLHFIEQPIDRFRFRYKSEMAGTHGSLTGMNSDKSRKQTYPTVELRNCTTNAIIRCSIYQINTQGPHAHRLIMKKGKDEHDDPHDLVVGPEDGWRATFHGMGIIHTAKKNLVSELVRKRTQLKMEHIAREEGTARKLTLKEEVDIKGLAEDESKSINLNIVCLRFDAFIKHNDKLYPICEPIFSHGINNLKSALTGELKIVRLDHVSSPACGGLEVFVLVERVTKKNIKIRFFELDDKEEEVWSSEGKFNDLDVHHQYAIVFKTPKYRDENIDRPVRVFVELVRPSDNARSEPREFTYQPVQKRKTGSKRPRYDSYYSSSSYNSSNVASNELPAVITNLNLGQNNVQNVMLDQDMVVVEHQFMANSWDATTEKLTSAELAMAINNIDSDEFRRLYQSIEKEYASICVDAPHKGMIVHEMDTPMYKQAPTEPRPRSVIKLEVLEEDRLLANRMYDELYSFSKTTHKPQDATKMIRFYLGNENRTNALHVFICQNNMEYTLFLLKFIAVKGLFDLVNVKNADMETPLQLAVRCQNEILVKYLVSCGAKVGIINGKMNTALHTAIEENVPIDILQELLTDRQHEKIREYIDARNEDGNTALIIAIERKNVAALKLLSMKGADINKGDQKSGFTPLRLAIEKQHLDTIRYILSLPGLEPLAPDFKDISALRAAHRRECSKEILEVIEKYMVENSLEVDIKEEVDEESDEEMEDVLEVKQEDISPVDLKELYKDVTAFTPQCLDEVAAILNESGRWEDLATLLGHSHLIRCGMISQENNVSKNLLKFAVESNNDTLWEIREFLEVLDVSPAVEAMDRMVQSMH